VEIETPEENCKRSIRSCFSEIKEEHRERVLKSLSLCRSNEERLQYLKGWLRYDER